MPSTRTAANVAEAAADTSVLVAAHVAGHVHHTSASRAAASCSHVLGTVLAETWSVLRRHFRLPATQTAEVLRDYTAGRQLVTAPPAAYEDVLERGAELQLSGNVHDFVIVRTATLSRLQLVTLDRGMERFAVGDVRRLT